MAVEKVRPVLWNGTALQLATGRVLLGGWSLKESTGLAGAVVEVRDGHDVTGELVAFSGMAAGGVDRAGPTTTVIELQSGLFVLAASGAASGVLYVVTNDG